MNTETPVRVGIVGLGNIGQYHADRLLELDADLVGGLDVKAEARRWFTEIYDVDTYEDADELFSQIDAVIVTTPNRFHEEYAVTALERGIDVLLEKPLAHTLESAERIADAAADSEAFCMVGFNNRFSNSVEIIKHYQQEDRFGDLMHVEANYVRRRGIPGRGTWFTNRDVAGGGALIDIGVHAVDLSLYFLDFPEVVEVSGTTRSQFGDREDYAFVDMWGDDVGPEGFDVEDSATAFIRCADGRTISLEVAWASNRPSTDEFFLRGTEGGVRLDREEYDLNIYEASTGGKNHLADTRIESESTDTHRAEQERFLRAAAEDAAPESNTVEEAITVQRVIAAIYRSSQKERAIRIDELADE